jgi:hypothetical protein
MVSLKLCCHLLILHSNVVTIGVTLNQTLRSSRILLKNNLVALNESVCLDKDLTRRSSGQDSRSDLGSEPLVYTGDTLVQILTSLEVGSSLVDLKLLQELIDGGTSVRLDLGPVELDSQVAEVVLGVLKLAKLWLRQEHLEDGVTSLHLRQVSISLVARE